MDKAFGRGKDLFRCVEEEGAEEKRGRATPKVSHTLFSWNSVQRGAAGPIRAAGPAHVARRRRGERWVETG